MSLKNSLFVIHIYIQVLTHKMNYIVINNRCVLAIKKKTFYFYICYLIDIFACKEACYFKAFSNIVVFNIVVS